MYTQLRPCHLSVRVGDGSWHSEEIVKISNGAFESDHCCICIVVVEFQLSVVQGKEINTKSM